MNKVYRKGTKGIVPDMDSAWIAARYAEHAKTIAKCVSQLDDVKNMVDHLHQITMDNGDVGFSLSNALEKLGIALADCVCYQAEYEQEANGDDDDEDSD